MKLLFFSIFLMAMPLFSQAQAKKVDTLTRKYILLEPRTNRGRTIVVPERKVIKVKTVNGRGYRGSLIIVNDSQIAILDKFDGEFDTLNLKYITKIRRPALEYQVLSYYLFMNGLSTMLIAGLVASPVGVAVGLTISALGVSVFDGPRYHAEKYKYKIVKTKGYKLKPVKLPIKPKPATQI
jgi:hypothetical protein